jgi:hypothetical protein
MLVELLISRCEFLMGVGVTKLMGEPPERDPTRQDSGAEESDSLHCKYFIGDTCIRKMLLIMA